MKGNNNIEKKIKKILEIDVTELEKKNEDRECEAVSVTITTLKAV